MLEANNTDYFNVSGIQINDPSINEDSVMIYCKFPSFTYAETLQTLPRKDVANPIQTPSIRRTTPKQIRLRLRAQRNLHDLDQRTGREMRLLRLHGLRIALPTHHQTALGAQHFRSRVLRLGRHCHGGHHGEPVLQLLPPDGLLSVLVG